MAPVFSPWMRRQAASPARRAKYRPIRNVNSRLLFLENLEDRTLLTAWGDIAGAFNAGVVSVSAKTTTLAQDAFDTSVSIPLVQSSFSRALDVPAKLQNPFGVRVDGNETDLARVRASLAQAGFMVDYLDVNPEMGSGDLIRLSKAIPFPAGQANFTVGGIGGSLGFSYFDDQVAGGLDPVTLQAGVQAAVFHVTFGVDLVGNVPQLFLQDSTRLDLPGVRGQVRLSGRMNIKNLLSVQIAGDAILNLDASLSLKSPNPSHKLHIDELTSANVVGRLSGSAAFANVSLTSQVSVLPPLTWAGNFLASITSDANGNKMVSKTGGPSALGNDPLAWAWGGFRGLVSGLFSGTGGLDFLKPIASALNFQIPLFNFTLGEKLGFGDLSQITGLVMPTIGAGGSDSVLQSAEAALNGLGIYVGIPPGGNPANQPTTLTALGTLLSRVVQGERVDLLSFSKKGGSKWGQSLCFTFLSLGVPGVADVHLDACFGGHVSWDYAVGFGIDTTGFYIDPGTHIGISGGVDAGLRGGLRVLGFDLASADGRIGLDASARLSIRNPDPSQGDRIYLDQIFRPGENLLQSILGAMKVDFTINVTAHVEAKLNLFLATITLFSHDWNLGRLVDVHVPLATTQSKRPVPLNLQNQDLSRDPNVTLANGLLTIDGRGSPADHPNLLMLSGKDHVVDANWQGHGIGHFTGVNQVKFLGGSGNDRVQVKPGFNVPIYAQGGSGSNYFEAGDGGSTLLGGGHADPDPNNTTSATLVGGAGRDSLVGGPGNNLLTAGTGDSTLIGGSGNATLYGGSGHDLLIGGLSADANDATTGRVYIQGGSGDSTIWAGGGDDTIIAGAGTDQVHGGRGNDLIIAGATIDPRADPVIVMGGGNDTIWGGSGNMSVRGGAGNDEIHGGTGRNTVHGGTGNDTIWGGPNGDLLLAGTGNDAITGGVGNDTLVAGPGADFLDGGPGDDLLDIPFGVVHDRLRARFVGGTGLDTLAVTTDDNDHYLRLTQSSPSTFTVTSLDLGTGQSRGAFTFDLPNDVNNSDIEVLGLQAVSGNNKLEVAPTVGKNVKLIGGKGNDTLMGGGGSNTLAGGTGDDLLVGGTTTGQHYNEFHGGTGNSTMIGGPGDDVFYGGTGDNDMRGGNGRVAMYGGTSLPGQRNKDLMRVGPQSVGAVLTGGANDATLVGGPGNDVLIAGAGNVEMHGGGGDDVLLGGGGNATLYGGDGYEVLIGGAGDNVLYGNDPTMPARQHTAEDWQYRFDRLRDQLDDVGDALDNIYCALHPGATIQKHHMPFVCPPPDHTLTNNEQAAFQARYDQLVGQAGEIGRQITNLANEHNNQNDIYHVPDVLVGGSGNNTIYGSPYADFILASRDTGTSNHRTTIYASGGDDTVTGTAGKDTFLVPITVDNADIVLTYTSVDGFNNVPDVKVRRRGDPVYQDEPVFVRGLNTIGVVAATGNNLIAAQLGSQALYNVYVAGGAGNNWIDLRGLPSKATVVGGSGNDTVVGGNAQGTEIDGSVTGGTTTYEVDGTAAADAVQVKAEAFQANGQTVPVLSVYVNGAQPQVRLTKMTAQRLLIKGLEGDDRITVGPLAVTINGTVTTYRFPDMTVDGGPGNNVLDARPVTTQAVTLLGGDGADTLYGSFIGNDYLEGGPGDDTLVAGIGPSYLDGGPGNDLLEYYQSSDSLQGGGGNDRFLAFTDFEPATSYWNRWDSQALSGSFRIPNYVFPRDNHYFVGQQTSATVAHTFTGMGTFTPSLQGTIAGLDFALDFRVEQGGAVQTGILLRQGSNLYFGPVNTYSQSASFQHWSGSLVSSNFRLISGTQATPDFGPSGAALSFGFYTVNTGGPQTLWNLDNFQLTIRAMTLSAAAATSFRVTPAVDPVAAGVARGITVTALDVSGNVATGYRGTVHFSSTDPQAILPPDYTFTAADNGVHTFTVTLKTAGSTMVSVAQTTFGIPSGSGTMTVLPATLDHFVVNASTTATTAGTAIRLTVQAWDGFGNLAALYRGTLQFTSTDPQAGLPTDYPFTAADGGVHTFTVFLRTTGTQTINLRDGAAGKTGSATVAITPAAMSGFLVMPATSSLNAGDTLAVAVRAVDAFGNVIAGYQGTATLSTFDNQTTLLQNYRFLPADGGSHTFTATLRTAGSHTLTVADQAAPALSGGATVGVVPLAASAFAVVPDPWSAGAGVPLRLTVSALDRFNNVVTGYRGTVAFSSSNRGATLPADYTFTAADNGVHTFTGVVLLVAETATVAVRDKNNPSLQAGAALPVLPAAAASFAVVASGTNPGAGTSLTLGVTALDVYGNVATGYTGTVHFSSSDRQAGLPADYTFTSADAGVHTFGATLYTAGSQTITATDTVTATITGTQGGIVVTPASPARFQVTSSVTSIIAGTSFDVTLTVLDAYGNTVTGYAGTVHFSSADPYGATLPADYTFQTADQGRHTFAGGATLYTAGTWDVTATDPGTGITGATTSSVTPAALDHFLVTTSADTVVAGAPFDVTVTAQDAYGNTVTGYTGTAAFSSADPYGASLPDAYAFQSADQGTVTFSGGATLYTTGIRDVTITDADAGVTGTANVTVTPAAADHFRIEVPATVAPGTPFDVTVTALDPYGNVDVNYRGTVTFTTSDSDPGVVLPPDYTFTDADAGVAVFSGGFTLMTLGDQTITATDTDSGITGTATVTVQSPGLGGAADPGAHRKARGAADGQILSPAQATAPVAAARPHHAPLSLAEALDQLFMEEGLIG